jgi:hypothetical protein
MLRSLSNACCERPCHWAAPAKVLTPQQVLAFEGWAPEVINGRLAMLGRALHSSTFWLNVSTFWGTF